MRFVNWVKISVSAESVNHDRLRIRTLVYICCAVHIDLSKCVRVCVLTTMGLEALFPIVLCLYLPNSMYVLSASL